MPRRTFDRVIAEALDWFSRDQEHIAGFYKLMSFAGVAVATLRFSGAGFSDTMRTQKCRLRTRCPRRCRSHWFN
jgi:hypothetical protein